MNPSWGFFNEFEGKSLWFYCVVCYAKEPRLDLKLKRQPAGILKYDKSNTALFKNHCNKKHLNECINFSSYFSEKMQSEKDKDKDKDKEELVLKSKKTNEVTKRFLFQGKPYGRDSNKQISFERHLCHLTAESLTTLSLYEMPAFRELVHFLDPIISPVSRTRLTRKLLPDMFKEKRKIASYAFKKISNNRLFLHFV